MVGRFEGGLQSNTFFFFYLQKMHPRGSRYKAKRTGPKIYPWGTPYLTGAPSELKGPRATENNPSSRYEQNHLGLVPFSLTQIFNRDKISLWSAVSKAAVLPDSIAKKLCKA